LRRLEEAKMWWASILLCASKWWSIQV